MPAGLGGAQSAGSADGNLLDITAQSGAGNLLGNLLCAAVNLLNSPSALANLLNKIILALIG